MFNIRLILTIDDSKSTKSAEVVPIVSNVIVKWYRVHKELIGGAYYSDYSFESVFKIICPEFCPSIHSAISVQISTIVTAISYMDAIVITNFVAINSVRIDYLL